MPLSHWDPFRDLVVIQHRLDRLPPTGAAGWAPPVDVYETDAALVLTAEVPGLAREAITIAVHDGRLIVEGRREGGPAGDTYHRLERGHGGFTRTFALPPTADAERISAELSEGVLTITVPRRAEATARRIDVR